MFFQRNSSYRLLQLQGWYSLKMKMYDENNNELTCITFDFYIGFGSSVADMQLQFVIDIYVHLHIDQFYKLKTTLIIVLSSLYYNSTRQDLLRLLNTNFMLLYLFSFYFLIMFDRQCISVYSYYTLRVLMWWNDIFLLCPITFRITK